MRNLILLAFAAAVSCYGEFCAGVAKTDLEPPLGTPMAGYGAARFAKGVPDPIEARVLAPSDGLR